MTPGLEPWGWHTPCTILRTNNYMKTLHAMALCRMTLLVGLLLMSLAAPSGASTLTVNGQGSVSMPTSLSTLSMTISNTGTTAAIARDGAAGLIRSTVDAVTNLPGIDTTRDIKTLTITFAPEVVRHGNIVLPRWVSGLGP